MSVAWSPDGNWPATGSNDRTVRLWKSDGTPGPVITEHSNNVNAVVLESHGRLVGLRERGWDCAALAVSDGSPGPQFKGSEKGLRGLAWSSDGNVSRSAAATRLFVFNLPQ